jgi:hypothetical protein
MKNFDLFIVSVVVFLPLVSLLVLLWVEREKVPTGPPPPVKRRRL